MLTRRHLLAAGAALPFGACAAAPAFRIGYQRNGLLLAAKARGSIEAALGRGASVGWVEYPSGPPLLEAMSVGGLEFGGTGDTPPIFAQAAGARIVYVAAQPVTGRAAAIVVPAASRLRSAADLKGAKLAYTRGSSAQNFIRAALRPDGLDLRDVETINLAPDQALAAFAAGAVDAWAIWDPFLAKAEVDHAARVLVAGNGLARSNSFLLANADAVVTKPELVRATLDALVVTAAWATQHRDQLVALIAAAGLAPKVAERIAARQDFGVIPLTGARIAEQQRLADALHASGQLPGAVVVERAIWHGWHPV